ncbi:MAG: hypothetical protein RR330_05480 [Alistipes sp.]
MTIKKYVLTDIQELTTTIIVNDEPRIINFSGGSRASGTRGFFVTDNSAVQDSIESSSRFGSVFKIEATITEPVTQPTTPTDGLSDPSVIQEPTVTSKNKAIKYLMDTYNATFSASTSIDEIKKDALEKYHTVFINW